MSYSDVKGPRLVGQNLASQISEYLMRVQELGAFEGPEGGLEISEDIKPVMEALHHVLAGGAVEFKITQRGNPDIVAELNRRAKQASDEGNAINKAAGFYLSVTV